LAPALVALAIGAGCGGGGGGGESASTQAPEQSGAQARANAKVERQNEEIRREYQQRKQSEAPTPVEEEAKHAASDFYSILGNAKVTEATSPDGSDAQVDSQAFCELMSAKAVRQTVHFAEVSSGIAQKWDCESAVKLLVARSKRTGGLSNLQGAEVLGVNVEGDKATATIKLGDGAATSIPLVKEDGEWKFAATAPGPSR
jgi:hypothetical protein